MFVTLFWSNASWQKIVLSYKMTHYMCRNWRYFNNKIAFWSKTACKYVSLLWPWHL